jgi:xanthine dehydrogenase small subunit
MSLYAHYLNRGECDPASVRDVLAGNLCRCTGYGPIIDAAGKMYDVPRLESAESANLATGDMLAISGERRFFAPRSRSELAAVLQEYPEAVLLGGATDVGLWVTKQYRNLPTIISVASVAELRRVRETPDAVEIGAAVTYTEALDVLTRLHPDFGELLRRLGSVQVRNAGTIGGNVANGSPIGDTPPPLIALGAMLVLGKGDSRRTLPLEDYFLSYGKQDRQPGEFIEEIVVPKLKSGSDFRVYKISKRFDQDISAVCAAFHFRRDGNTVREARIAFGGMAGTPRRAAAAEAALNRKPFTEATVRTAMAAMEKDFTPLTDMRASARYRMDTAKNLLLKAYLEISGAGATRVLEVADG